MANTLISSNRLLSFLFTNITSDTGIIITGSLYAKNISLSQLTKGIVKVTDTGAITSGTVNLGSSEEVSGVTRVTNGGTGISSIPANSLLVTDSVGILSTKTLANSNELIISHTNLAKVETLTGTSNQIIITNDGTVINFALPQNINATADVAFSSLSLNSETDQLQLGPDATQLTINTSDITTAKTFNMQNAPDDSSFLMSEGDNTISNGTLTINTTPNLTNGLDMTTDNNQITFGSTTKKISLNFDPTVRAASITVGLPTNISGTDLQLNINANTKILYVKKDTSLNRGEFNSVVDALNSINDASESNPYVIIVYPGIYIENKIIMKQFVDVIGVDEYLCKLKFNSSISDYFVVGIYNTSLQCLTLIGEGNEIALINCENNTNTTFVLTNVVLDAVNSYIHSINSRINIILCDFIMTHLLPTSIGVDINGGVTYINNCKIKRSSVTEIVDFSRLFNIYATSIIYMSDCIFDILIDEDTHIGECRCIHFTDNVQLNIVASAISNFYIGIYNEIGTGVAIIQTIALTVLSSVYKNLYINDQTTIGTIGGFINIETSFITQQNTGITLFTNCINGSSIIGIMNMGNSLDESTNVTPLITQGTSAGLYSGGDIQYLIDSTIVTVFAGSGYIFNNYIKYITWDTQTIDVNTSNETDYIYINSVGIIQKSTSSPSELSNIVIGKVRVNANGNGILYGQYIPHIGTQLSNKLNESLEIIIGCVFGTGGTITKNGNLKLDITNGEFYMSSHKYTFDSSTEIMLIHCIGSQELFEDSTQYVKYDKYDNGSGAVDITANYFVKHTLYLIGGSTNTYTHSQIFVMLLGREQYGTLLEAQEGIVATALSSWNYNVIRVGYIIVKNTAVDADKITEIINDKPSITNTTSGSTSAIIFHDTLIGRENNSNHPQYLLRSGNDDGMNGELNLSTNNIVNVGTLSFNNLTNGVAKISSNVLTSSGSININTETTGTVTINRGGTNSVTTLNNNRMIISTGDSIKEHIALTDGQIFVGKTNNLPEAYTLANDGDVNVTINNLTNKITFNTEQNVTSTGTPTFTSVQTNTINENTPSNGTNINGIQLKSTSLSVPTASTFIFNGTTYNTTIKASTTPTSNTTINLPPDAGLSGTVLTTNGAGITTWGIPSSSLMNIYTTEASAQSELENNASGTKIAFYKKTNPFDITKTDIMVSIKVATNSYMSLALFTY